MRRMDRIVGVILLALSLPAATAGQDRPFVYSLTTTTDTPASQIRVDLDVGIGEDSFHQQVSNGPEQRLGVQASRGRLTFVGKAGFATVADTYQTSEQGELFVSLPALGMSRSALAVGGGVLHEAGGANVLLLRVTGGRESPRARLYGNLLFEKPLVPGRDSLDLITSVGLAARVTPAWALGIEAIGEDLEGFWNPSEAEGGARILIGPSIHLAPPQKPWQVSVAGGPSFHPSTSPFMSDAVRALPPTTAAYSYAVRTTFSYRF